MILLLLYTQYTYTYVYIHIYIVSKVVSPTILHCIRILFIASIYSVLYSLGFVRHKLKYYVQIYM